MEIRRVFMKQIKITVSTVVIFLLMLGYAQARIIFQDDFDGYTDSPGNHGWGISSNISLQPSGGMNNSQCVMVTYDRPGTPPYWFGRNVSDENLQEIYVRFYFKVDDPSGGCKFLKLFGKENSPQGYANSTFAINYFSGQLSEVSYGDGSGVSNDTQHVIRYNGSHTDSNVSIVNSSDTFDPRDGKWHCFEANMKYNDNGKRNGHYRVWIDGKLRLYANNVKNRNDLNSLFFGSVQLANYCHSNWEKTWHLWYDNVIIADQYIGPLDNVSQDNQAPVSPTGINVLIGN